MANSGYGEFRLWRILVMVNSDCQRKEYRRNLCHDTFHSTRNKKKTVAQICGNLLVLNKLPKAVVGLFVSFILLCAHFWSVCSATQFGNCKKFYNAFVDLVLLCLFCAFCARAVPYAFPWPLTIIADYGKLIRFKNSKTTNLFFASFPRRNYLYLIFLLLGQWTHKIAKNQRKMKRKLAAIIYSTTRTVKVRAQ